jgi:hypothetical protein
MAVEPRKRAVAAPPYAVAVLFTRREIPDFAVRIMSRRSSLSAVAVSTLTQP